MEWISIKNKKPMNHQWVIISNENKVFVAEYFKDIDVFSMIDFKFLNVTHWMPLPKPAKK